MKRLVGFAALLLLAAALSYVPGEATDTTTATRVTYYSPEWTVYRCTSTIADSTYPTNGESVSLGAYLSKIDAIWLETPVSTDGYVVTIVDSTISSGTMKLKLWVPKADSTGMLEVSDSLNVGTTTIRYYIAGRK